MSLATFTRNGERLNRTVDADGDDDDDRSKGEVAAYDGFSRSYRSGLQLSGWFSIEMTIWDRKAFFAKGFDSSIG